MSRVSEPGVEAGWVDEEPSSGSEDELTESRADVRRLRAELADAKATIAELRAQLVATAKQLADASEVVRGVVSLYEDQKRRPRAEDLTEMMRLRRIVGDQAAQLRVLTLGNVPSGSCAAEPALAAPAAEADPLGAGGGSSEGGVPPASRVRLQLTTALGSGRSAAAAAAAGPPRPSPVEDAACQQSPSSSVSADLVSPQGILKRASPLLSGGSAGPKDAGGCPSRHHVSFRFGELPAATLTLAAGDGTEPQRPTAAPPLPAVDPAAAAGTVDGETALLRAPANPGTDHGRGAGEAGAAVPSAVPVVRSPDC